MATPQIENGYTKIANDLLDEIIKIRISGEARQVLDFIIRKTYGFNKKKDRISLSQFCLATSLKKPTVCKAINKLLSMQIILKIDTELGMVYELQKDTKKWLPLPKKITSKSLPKKIIIVTQKDNASLPKKIPTKDNTTKDNTKERERTPYEVSKDFFGLQDETPLDPYREKVPEHILRPEAQKFILYWTEPNKSGTRQRWELERTFDVHRRLATWFSRVKSYQPNTKNRTII